MHSSIRGKTLFGPGNLDEQVAAASALVESLAISTVFDVSYASSGETSSETQPSTPSVTSWTGRKRSAARLMSSIASSKKRSSPERPSAAFVRMASS